MKKILFVILIFIGFKGLAQVDSSTIRISGIVLKGKDFKIVAFFCMKNSARYPTIDSIVKVVGEPGESNDVTFNSVPNRQWFKMYQDFKQSPTCLVSINNNFKRLDDELRLHGSVWLIWRLNNDEFQYDAENTIMKKAGASYAKKEDVN